MPAYLKELKLKKQRIKKKDLKIQLKNTNSLCFQNKMKSTGCFCFFKIKQYMQWLRESKIYNENAKHKNEIYKNN